MSDTIDKILEEIHKNRVVELPPKKKEIFSDDDIAEQTEDLQRCLYSVRREIFDLLCEKWEEEVKSFGFRFTKDDYYGTSISEDSEYDFRNQFLKVWKVKDLKEELMKSESFTKALDELLETFAFDYDIPEDLAEPEQPDYDAMYKMERGG